jgi:hypothetical protein
MKARRYINLLLLLIGALRVQNWQAWRDLLGKIIKDPQEKQRIANESGISTVTLFRWASGESQPRSQNLRQLLNSLPAYRQMLLEVLPENAMKSVVELTDNSNPGALEIPAEFYANVLQSHCFLPDALHRDWLCELIFEQILQQLDPNSLGMQITLARCTAPGRNHKIRSLREIMRSSTMAGSEAWRSEKFFLGAESLAGHAVTMGHYLIIHSYEEGQQTFPTHWKKWEKCALAYPVMQVNQVAGCLVISSAVPDYFHPHALHRLIQHYAELLSLVFAPQEFYDISLIEPGHMPSYNVQIPYLARMHRRIAEVMLQTHTSVIEAEALVWQHIEEELLSLPSVSTPVLVGQ